MLDSYPLRCFVAVARELHFGRTADRLQMAQSALSRHIRELEKELGVRLLNRGRRSAITLTDAGQALLVEAELAVAQLDRAETVARQAAKGEVGHLDVGYVLSASLSGILPRVLARFREAYPDVEVRLNAMETPRQLEALRTGLLDVGFARARQSYPTGVNASVVHREPLLLAMPANHALAKKKVALAALINERFIVPEVDDTAGFVEHLSKLAARGGFQVAPAIRVRDFITAATLAAANYGVVLAPRSLASIYLHNLICKPIREYDGQAELVIAHRTTTPRLAAQRFVQIAKGLRQ